MSELDREYLEGCETTCLTGDLIACPLSQDEQDICPGKLIYSVRKLEKAATEMLTASSILEHRLEWKVNHARCNADGETPPTNLRPQGS